MEVNNMFLGRNCIFLVDNEFVRGGSKFDLWSLRSVHFSLINCWKLFFQLVRTENLIFCCPEKDWIMTNRDPWQTDNRIKCYSACLLYKAEWRNFKSMPIAHFVPHPAEWRWAEWGSWSSCSKSCGGGKLTRERACIYYSIPVDCDLMQFSSWSKETKSCQSHFCPGDSIE